MRGLKPSLNAELGTDWSDSSRSTASRRRETVSNGLQRNSLPMPVVMRGPDGGAKF